ncbi:MAG: LCP family protein [Clostridiales bacterium]|nr:LCP family protein [Clostridiales bacterium]
MKTNRNDNGVRRPVKKEAEQFHVEHINAKGKVVHSKKGMKEKKPWTFKRVFLRIILPILLVLTIIIGGVVIWFLRWEDHVLNQIEYIPVDTNPTFINESSSIVELSEYTSETSIPHVEEEHIHNFLLIGVDSRSKKLSEDGKGSLADVIMIMSVDNKEGTIKLVTIQRDCYVYIPGHSKPQKINAAMSYGGPELLSAVIENHLRLELEGYAYVNFYNMEKVIDAVDGIDLEVTKSEVNHVPGGLNENLKEQNKLLGVPEDTYKVTSSGLIHLNGRQAVAYSRIREVGNGVYGRSERQVKVLNALLKKFSDLSTTNKMSAMDDIASMIATNISKKEIKHYAFDFLPEVRNMEIQTMGIPVDGYSRQGMFSDIRANEWSIRPDWNGMIPLIQEFLYGETFEFDPVEKIPKAPSQDED